MADYSAPKSGIDQTSEEALNILAAPDLDVQTKARMYTQAQKRLQDNLRNVTPDEFHSNTSLIADNARVTSIHSPVTSRGSLDPDPPAPEGEPVKRRLQGASLDVRDRSDFEFFITDSLKNLSESEKKSAHKLISIIHESLRMSNSDIMNIGQTLHITRRQFREYITFLASEKELTADKVPVSLIIEINNLVEQSLIKNKNLKYKPVDDRDVESELSKRSNSLQLDELKHYLEHKESILKGIKEQLRLNRIRTLVNTLPPRDERMWVTKGLDWLLGRHNEPYGIDSIVKKVPKPWREDARNKLFTLKKLNLLSWNEKGEIIDAQHLWKNTNIKDIAEFWFANPNRIKHKVEFRPTGADEFLAKVLLAQTQLMTPPDSPLRKIINLQTKLIKNGVNLITFFYSFYRIINQVFGFDLITWLTVALTILNASLANLAGNLSALARQSGIIPRWAGAGIQETLKGAGYVIDKTTSGLNPILKIGIILKARNFISWLYENSHWLVTSMISVIAYYNSGRRGAPPLQIE